MIVFSMGLTADGYIADPDGSFDWGAPSEELHEFELFVSPVVIGSGTPYFPPDVQIDLEPVETRTFDEAVYLRYGRRRP